ncbi:unnamed protein product [Soboliphyme baturini]|uniref:J domain-containing protein n=1 Tax=Soboliphyme baturini TaxID=241478 RepID=A0A183IC57_9BILA|nr:unnamed protein product [Soboliphyme baturini]
MMRECDIKRNFYEVLGVSRSATNQDIKQAYFGLCKKLHPDSASCSKSTSRFIELNEAYTVLSSAALRSQYDGFLAGSDQPKYDYWSYTARPTYPDSLFYHYRESNWTSAGQEDIGWVGRTAAFLFCFVLFAVMTFQTIRLRIAIQRRMLREHHARMAAMLHEEEQIAYA